MRTLKQHIAVHLDRESRLCGAYDEWQGTWLVRVEQLRRQIGELEARVAPWLPRGESPRLAIVSRTEEAG